MQPPLFDPRFLDRMASGSAAPGGGAAAAAAGAMGAALVSMVCNLTIGRKQHHAVQSEMERLLTRSEALRSTLTRYIEEDALAFTAVMAAYRLPRETEQHRLERAAEIERRLKEATRLPLATARACGAVIDLAQKAATLGNRHAAGDAAAGAACAHAGLTIACLDVQLNLTSINDGAFVAQCRADLKPLLSMTSVVEEVYERVKQRAP